VIVVGRGAAGTAWNEHRLQLQIYRLPGHHHPADPTKADTVMTSPATRSLNVCYMTRVVNS
jgi:hypothetical protein